MTMGSTGMLLMNFVFNDIDAFEDEISTQQVTTSEKVHILFVFGMVAF